MRRWGWGYSAAGVRWDCGWAWSCGGDGAGCCGDGDGDAVSDEQAALVHRVVQGAVIEAQDGAQSTVRSNVFDQLGGRDVWPAGRSGESQR